MTCAVFHNWYDRQGKPLTCPKEIEQLLEDRAYKRVAETTLPDGKWVSTVWLGIDHSFGMGRPLIFETMVFPSRGDGHDLGCERYATETEAAEGHERMVRLWSIGEP
mgnify:CR=1 FL=1